MADTAPPKLPHPKAAAKGLGGLLKGKPAWVYVAGVTIIIGVAYMAYRRSATAETDMASVVDNTGGSVGDSSLYPSASQGAWGGYTDPGLVSDVNPGMVDNAGNPESPAPINIYLPGPVSGDGSGAAFDPASQGTAYDITGGGPAPKPTSAAHAPVAARTMARAVQMVQAIQAATPAHQATAAQQTAQAQALVTTPTAVFAQDNGTRSGLNYKVILKASPANGNKRWKYRYYESRPGKGDWGEGGKVAVGPA